MALCTSKNESDSKTNHKKRRRDETDTTDGREHDDETVTQRRKTETSNQEVLLPGQILRLQWQKEDREKEMLQNKMRTDPMFNLHIDEKKMTRDKTINDGNALIDLPFELWYELAFNTISQKALLEISQTCLALAYNFHKAKKTRVRSLVFRKTMPKYVGIQPSLTHKHVIDLATQLPNIQTLIIRAYDFRYSSLLTVAKCWPRLQELELNSGSKLTIMPETYALCNPIEIQSLLGGLHACCPNLQKLVLIDIGESLPDILDGAIRLSKLQTLRCWWTRGLVSLAPYAMDADQTGYYRTIYRHVRDLPADQCKRLKFLFPSLTSLELGGDDWGVSGNEEELQKFFAVLLFCPLGRVVLKGHLNLGMDLYNQLAFQYKTLETLELLAYTGGKVNRSHKAFDALIEKCPRLKSLTMAESTFACEIPRKLKPEDPISLYLQFRPTDPVTLDVIRKINDAGCDLILTMTDENKTYTLPFRADPKVYQCKIRELNYTVPEDGETMVRRGHEHEHATLYIEPGKPKNQNEKAPARSNGRGPNRLVNLIWW